MRSLSTHRWLGLGLLALIAGCDDSTGPGMAAGTGTLSLSVGVAGVAGSATAAEPALFAEGLTLEDGTNTLEITSAEIVLREIELERVRDLAGCDDDDDAVGADDDFCEEFQIGPRLVDLPLDGSVTRQITATVDADSYDEIEFDIHKVDDDDPANADFLAEHPDFRDISIRVIGNFNGVDFIFTSDLNEEQEIELAEPLVVDEETEAVNLTLTIDLSTWFRAAGGALIDPSSAVKGQPNENLVKDNIRTSIEGFPDDDGDGIPNGEDDDADDGETG